MPRRSITLRLTLLFASVSTGVLLVLGLLVAQLVERHFVELDMSVLRGEFELVARALQDAHSEPALARVPAPIAASVAGNHDLSVLVTAPDGRTLFASAGADFPPALLAGASEEPPNPYEWTAPDGRKLRGIAAKTRTGIRGAAPAVVAVSADLMHHEHFMTSFKQTLWLVVTAAAALSGVFGWVAVRRGLAPLREIRRSAASITANRLDQRLSADFPAELAEVARTLNDMLARLEESFRRLSDFSSDLAHELRTPVSNLLTQTEVTLSKVRTEREYRDVLASNVEELERLSRTISDMLFLAKSDNRLLVPQREQVDLGAEAQQVLEFYEAIADEKDVRMTCSGAGAVSCDRLMLRRAISNLVSNAVRHAPNSGQVAVRVRENLPSSVTLSVENTGDTVPAESLPRLFDRFYRADASRRHFGEGAGLGLAITRSIARAHGGDVSVRSANGVTTFDLLIPVGPSAASP